MYACITVPHHHRETQAPVCMCVCMYVCMYVCIITEIHKRLYVCVYICMYVCACVFVCVHVCMCSRITYSSRHKLLYVCMCVYAGKYVRGNTKMHTCPRITGVCKYLCMFPCCMYVYVWTYAWHALMQVCVHVKYTHRHTMLVCIMYVCVFRER
jgi:hypothetical protein